MKHTEQEIIEKAQLIMKDLDGKFYFDSCVKEAVFKDTELSYGKQKGETHPTWIIGIKAIFDNEDLLFISDETGEPLYYQNFNTDVFDLEKGSDGKYYRDEN